MTNPDNIDTSTQSLMINEDRIDANRMNATAPYNVTQNAQILKVDLANPTDIVHIAYVNQIEDGEVGIKRDIGCIEILWRWYVACRCSSTYNR